MSACVAIWLTSSFRSGYVQTYAEIGTVKHTAQRLGVSEDTVRKVAPPLDPSLSRERADADGEARCGTIRLLRGQHVLPAVLC